MNFCPSCGAASSGERFCTACGDEVPAPGAVLTEAALPASAPVGGTNPWLVAVAVVLLLGTIAVGGLLLLRHDDPAPSVKDRTRATPTANVPSGVDVPSPIPTETVTITATPTPDAAPRVCWNGDLAPESGTCDHSSADAARAAFNLQGRSCVSSGMGADHAGAVNLECGDLHVAIYESVEARERRLEGYGLGRGGCENYPDGIVFCGPDKDGRYVRTFARSTGILLYVSSLNHDSVAGVDQMAADLFLYGQPGE